MVKECIIALIGFFGSGKSEAAKMLERILESLKSYPVRPGKKDLEKRCPKVTVL